MRKRDFIDSLRGFYNYIKNNSLVTFGENLPKKEEVLANLYSDIQNKTYQPSLPREYIISNKSNYVSRIIPTFTLKDFCTYFYCINNLQDCVCDVKDRTEGTFGGWSITNPIQSMDVIEKENMINNCEWYEYISVSSLTISQWMSNWKEFSKLSYAKSMEYENNQFSEDYIVALFDIANFYDTIKLDILEKKLRLKCQSAEKSLIIDLLMYFLKYWNKPFEGYFPKSCGLPQEETGDCSRILANFYLRDYDKEIKALCDDYNCDYLRFADDMTIFAPNKKIAEFIIFEASKILHKIGLNINCSKVKFFNKTQYQEYQAFNILALLDEKCTSEKISKAIRLYFEYINSNKDFRKDRVIRRLISVLSQQKNQELPREFREKIFKMLLDTETLSTSNVYYLKKVYNIMKNEGREKELLKKLDELIPEVNFNSFHYELLAFYKKIKRTNFDNQILIDAINKRKIIK